MGVIFDKGFCNVSPVDFHQKIMMDMTDHHMVQLTLCHRWPEPWCLQAEKSSEGEQEDAWWTRHSLLTCKHMLQTSGVLAFKFRIGKAKLLRKKWWQFRIVINDRGVHISRDECWGQEVVVLWRFLTNELITLENSIRNSSSVVSGDMCLLQFWSPLLVHSVW